MNALSYFAVRRSHVGTRLKFAAPGVWCSLPQPEIEPNFERALTSAQRSAAQNGHHCIPRKNTRTLAAACAGASPTDLNMPGTGFTGVIFAGGVQPTGAEEAVPMGRPAVTSPAATFGTAVAKDSAVVELAAGAVGEAAGAHAAATSAHAANTMK